MIDSIIKNEHAGSYSRRQQLFMRYTFFVLIDLAILNLYDQYWDRVYLESFSISLMATILLQILMQITIAIEHRVADFFKSKSGFHFKVFRGLTTWAILFVSKLIILWLINLLFGDSVLFSGAMHGVVAFIVVVFSMIAIEQGFLKIYRSLG